jgi:hypothetical protein
VSTSATPTTSPISATTPPGTTTPGTTSGTSTPGTSTPGSTTGTTTPGTTTPGTTTPGTTTPGTTTTATSAPRPDGRPGAANTGVPTGTALTVVTGDQVFTQDNQVVTGKDFHGYVVVRAKNVTFRNSVFRGGNPDGRNRALLDADDGTGTVVEDSEFVAAKPAATVDGIWADNMRILRANVHGGVDGIKTGSNVLIQDSWIHDMNWFASDPNQGGGATHNDGVQSFDGTSGVTLRGNAIDMSTTRSANAAWQSSARDSSATGNYLDGGGCILNFDDHGPALTGIVVTDNRFGRHSAFQCPILLSSNASLASNTGNVWDDTGAPIPSPQQHD